MSAEGDGFVNLYVVDDENKRIDVDGDLLLPSHVAALLDFYDQRVSVLLITSAPADTLLSGVM